ncbi:VOC family protein [Micromonospora sp. NPDC050495]|uniref:VOC family protein n=1 Tax=Micromonospora sp. NPDC050495 TaxID=3154936 RepID=UPI00340B2FC5
MGQPVAWFEIAVKDGAKSRQFYADLFDWKLNYVEQMNYAMIDTGGEGIPGGIGTAGDGRTSGVLIYVVVDDINAALKKVGSLGGKTEVKPYEIPGTGHLAVFSDVEGNRMGLWQRV